nr:MAG TPA: hypothetical protein [Caudoviricetes sp.]
MEEEIYRQVLKDCEDAISNTLKKSKKLLTETIREKVYKPNTPKVYRRTYTFEDGWQLGEKTRGLLNRSQSLEYDDLIPVFDGNDYVHGNMRLDRRPILPTILEDGMWNKTNSDFRGALNISTNENENYWETFKKRLDSEIYKYLDEELEKVGLTRR